MAKKPDSGATDGNVYDYKLFKSKPREGLRSPKNHRFHTQALFVETCPAGQEENILWCLSEYEQPHPITGRIMPSAWQVYMHANSEYDAMRILVGSAEQWQVLKSLEWFRRHYLAWELDLQMKEKSNIRKSLMSIVNAEQGGATAAAKVLLQEFNTVVPKEKKKPGRPSEKDTSTEDAKRAAEDADAEDDVKRILEFKKGQA